MITTGIDIVTIKKISEIIKKQPAFVQRYFGQDEQKLFALKKSEKSRIQTIAANFAGKEAFSKAIGTGVRGFSLHEVEILRDELQAPYIQLSGKASALSQVIKKSFTISLSHTQEYAVAVVILYDL